LRCSGHGPKRASAEEIDRVNILQATYLAMRRAVAGLAVKPQGAAVDGNRDPSLPVPTTQTVIKGDGKIAAIAAASILAKTVRDEKLRELHERFPQYGFAKHKGYPTAKHVAALARFGPCPEHRKSFAPVAQAGLF
jgi:ribonuclease HII